MTALVVAHRSVPAATILQFHARALVHKPHRYVPAVAPTIPGVTLPLIAIKTHAWQTPETARSALKPATAPQATVPMDIAAQTEIVVTHRTIALPNIQPRRAAMRSVHAKAQEQMQPARRADVRQYSPTTIQRVVERHVNVFNTLTSTVMVHGSKSLRSAQPTAV